MSSKSIQDGKVLARTVCLVAESRLGAGSRRERGRNGIKRWPD